MSAAPGETRYSRTGRALHALMAVLIGFNLWLGLMMSDLTPISRKFSAFGWHKLIGFMVLALLLARVLWRWRTKAPPLPERMPRWQQSAARIGHGLLYVLMLAVPLSGWLYHSASGLPLRWFGWLALPNLIAANPNWKPVLQDVHVALSWTLIWVLALHVLAALKHHFIDRDLSLSRMWSHRS